MNQSIINGSQPQHQPPHNQYSRRDSSAAQGPTTHPVGIEHPGRYPPQQQQQPPQSAPHYEGNMNHRPTAVIHLPPNATVTRMPAGIMGPNPIPMQQYPNYPQMFQQPFIQGNTPLHPFPAFADPMLLPPQGRIGGGMGPTHPLPPHSQSAQPPQQFGVPHPHHSQMQGPVPAQIQPGQVPTTAQFPSAPPPSQQLPSQPPPLQRKKKILEILDPETNKAINAVELEKAAKTGKESSPASAQSGEAGVGEKAEDSKEQPSSPAPADEKATEIRTNFMKVITNQCLDVKADAKGAPVPTGESTPMEGGKDQFKMAAAPSSQEQKATPPSADERDSANAHKEVGSTTEIHGEPHHVANFQKPAFLANQPPLRPPMQGPFASNRSPNGNLPPGAQVLGSFQPPFQSAIMPTPYQPRASMGHPPLRPTDTSIPPPSSEEFNGRDMGEENGLDSALNKEDRLRQLDEELSELMLNPKEKEDVDSKVYSAEFFMLMRKLVKELQCVKCPQLEVELVDVGIDLAGMPASVLTNMPRATRPFEPGKSTFLPSWQRPEMLATRTDRQGLRPQYAGRTTDNKGRPKKGLPQRPSLPPPLKADLLPKRSEQAWKPKREEKLEDRSIDDARYEDIKKDVRGLLNKITPSNYDDLSNKFCDYRVHQDQKLLTRIIDLIFDKAVEEPRFCPLYSDLCKLQVEKEGQQQQQSGEQKKGTFRLAIIERCQKTFEGDKGPELKEAEKELEEAEKETDEAKKATIQERLDILKGKEKRRFLGIILFIAQLYRHDLLIDKIIEWCIVELIRRYGENNVNDEIYVEYAVKMLETVGPIYERRKTRQQQQQPQSALTVETPERKKSSHVVARKSMQKGAPPSPAASSPAAEPQQDQLEKVMTHLSALKSKLSNRCRFMIMDLEDLRRSGWQPRHAKQGPKTMKEVREDLEQEAAENQEERDEYERKARETARGPEYSGRKSSRQNPVPGYQGRGSTGSRAQQQNAPFDKRAAAAQASTQATPFSAQVKRDFMSLKQVDQQQSKLGKAPSFFSRARPENAGPAGGSERAAPSPPSSAPTPPPSIHQSSSRSSLLPSVEEGTMLASNDVSSAASEGWRKESSYPHSGTSNVASPGTNQEEVKEDEK